MSWFQTRINAKMAPTTKISPEAKAKAKADKFLKLAPPRVAKALKAIELIGNLANKSSYGYTPEQVAKIKAALDAATSKTLARFAPDAKDAPAAGFSF